MVGWKHKTIAATEAADAASKKAHYEKNKEAKKAAKKAAKEAAAEKKKKENEAAKLRMRESRARKRAAKMSNSNNNTNGQGQGGGNLKPPPPAADGKGGGDGDLKPAAAVAFGGSNSAGSNGVGFGGGAGGFGFPARQHAQSPGAGFLPAVGRYRGTPQRSAQAQAAQEALSELRASAAQARQQQQLESSSRGHDLLLQRLAAHGTPQQCAVAAASHGWTAAMVQGQRDAILGALAAGGGAVGGEDPFHPFEDIDQPPRTPHPPSAARTPRQSSLRRLLDGCSSDPELPPMPDSTPLGEKFERQCERERAASSPLRSDPIGLASALSGSASTLSPIDEGYEGPGDGTRPFTVRFGISGQAVEVPLASSASRGGGSQLTPRSGSAGLGAVAASGGDASATAGGDGASKTTPRSGSAGLKAESTPGRARGVARRAASPAGGDARRRRVNEFGEHLPVDAEGDVVSDADAEADKKLLREREGVEDMCAQIDNGPGDGEYVPIPCLGCGAVVPKDGSCPTTTCPYYIRPTALDGNWAGCFQRYSPGNQRSTRWKCNHCNDYHEPSVDMCQHCNERRGTFPTPPPPQSPSAPPQEGLINRLNANGESVRRSARLRRRDERED